MQSRSIRQVSPEREPYPTTHHQIPQMFQGAAGSLSHTASPQPSQTPQQQEQQEQYQNNNNATTEERSPSNRPVVRLSVSLIDTYRHIDTVHQQEMRKREAASHLAQ